MPSYNYPYSYSSDYAYGGYGWNMMRGPGLLFPLAVYLYFAYALKTISDKTKTPNSWMAWVPILNIFQFVKVAGKSYWWVLLFLIPLVNLVVGIYLWMEIAKRRGFDSWLGLLMIIPLVNIFIPGYLAFAEPKKK